MNIDWNAPLRTKHNPPRFARLMDGLGAGGKRRVAITGDYALSRDPRGLTGLAAGAFTGNNDNGGWPTVFLLDEQGRCNVNRAESPFDLINAPSEHSQAA